MVVFWVCVFLVFLGAMLTAAKMLGKRLGAGQKKTLPKASFAKGKASELPQWTRHVVKCISSNPDPHSMATIAKLNHRHRHRRAVVIFFVA